MDILNFAQPIRGGFYITALVVCVLFLTFIKQAKLTHKGYLTGFLGIKMTMALCEWLIIHVPMPQSHIWLSLLFVLSFGSAPLLLRFARGVTNTPNQALSHKFKLWEWAFILASIALVTPLFMASQVLFYFEFGGEFGHFIHVTMLLCVLLFVAQVSVYWQKAFKIYKLEVRRTMQQFSSLHGRSLLVLKLLLVLVLANLVFSLIRTFNCWFWQSQIEITVIANIMEYAILLGCLFYIFHGALPASTPDATTTIQAIIDENTAAPSSSTSPHTPETDKSPKYAKTKLDSQFIKRVQAKLLNKDNVTQLALDSGISLAKFADAIGEKPYYVTQILNQDLHTNFYEFITEHRIQHVMSKLSEPSEQTILDIALTAGFNSKSTFNTAFKKQTGQTPSQYRKQIPQSSPLST
ncbi:helix-turn-helix domain-containing protein [Paraglaciecola aquimarina]|uniref:Helix-turn-helix domain-containing protein n=1 Tax=Paraglaciecola algarum TaxID=3050085 RepID=A0ABS9D928_9ALTE|nr:helix-turn-helix domain-containing protein [Paraglaciecola sp. G1-23]MCF2949424.1 helix-turn-helix domain-containing protein [Paraglaciecola sp. G1-23]